MPLLIVCGFPSSGKTRRAYEVARCMASRGHNIVCVHEERPPTHYPAVAADAAIESAAPPSSDQAPSATDATSEGAAPSSSDQAPSAAASTPPTSSGPSVLSATAIPAASTSTSASATAVPAPAPSPAADAASGIYPPAGARRATVIAEKKTRGALRAETERRLGRDVLVIVDALNYVKGFRYELYCLARSVKTTTAVLHVATRNTDCLAWEAARGSPYGGTLVRELLQRFEAPDNRNRWDKPLFALLPEDPLPADAIEAALYSRTAPEPHLATQVQPAVETNFLHVLDRTTQAIIAAIVAAAKTAVPGDKLVVPGTDARVVLRKTPTLMELRRVQRQFISYTKMHPVADTRVLAGLYVDFVNNSGASG